MAARRHLVDTSVVIPLVMASHEAHIHVTSVIGRRRLHLPAHAAAESFSVLTRLPGDARLDARDAAALLEDRFVEVVATPVSFEVIGRLAAAGIAGGAVYDAIVASAASDHDILLTRDARARTTYERLGVTVEVIA